MLQIDPKKRLTIQEVLGQLDLSCLSFFFFQIIYDDICNNASHDFAAFAIIFQIARLFLKNFFLDHPWLQNAKKAADGGNLGEIVRARLKQFSVMNRFKKKVMRVS